MKRKRKILPARCSRTKIHYLWFMTMTSFFPCVCILHCHYCTIVLQHCSSSYWFLRVTSVFCCKILLNNPFGRQKDRRGWGSSCKRRSNVFTLKFSHMQLPKYFHLLLKDYIESWILNQIKEALTDSICGSIRPADISSSSSR